MSGPMRDLREQNKILRANVVQLCREKEVLHEHIAFLSAQVLELRHRAGLAPHDYEPPCRPGLNEAD